MGTTTSTSATEGLITVTFLLPRGGQFDAEIGSETTGQHAIDGLVGAGSLDAPSRERAYTLQRQKGGQTIPLSETLVASGVGHGDTVAVVQTNSGAARQTPAELRSRLAFDAATVLALKAPTLGEVHAYASGADRNAGRTLPAAAARSGEATCYVVDYTFPILVARDRTAPKVSVSFDLLASGNYPYTAPFARCLSPVPWNTHVASSGTVCLGSAWEEARGKMLFAQLVVHVMHLLNWDEPDRGAAHDGFNSEALAFWRDRLRSRPLHAGLVYPALPAELTHGVRSAAALFRAAPNPTVTAVPAARATAARPAGGFQALRRSP